MLVARLIRGLLWSLIGALIWNLLLWGLIWNLLLWGLIWSLLLWGLIWGLLLWGLIWSLHSCPAVSTKLSMIGKLGPAL